MQKISPSALLLFAAVTVAQSADVTSYLPVCPTASSTTTTLPTTVTYCPGPHCNGGGTGPMITPAPNGVGMPGVLVGQYTSVGPDGHTTELGIYETVYDSMCKTGLVPATYTITAPCPCSETPHPTVMPSGFQTTVVPCHVCTQTGGPASVTLTTPCPTGPYASVTPSTGPAPTAGVPAPMTPAAPAAAAASAGSSGVAPSASSAASTPAGAAPAAPMSAQPSAANVAPAAGSPASPMAPAASPVAPAAAGKPNNSTMPVPSSPKAPVSPYTGAATQISVGTLAILVGLAAALL